MEEVKPKRAYRSARRQQSAADTRNAILASAHAAFLRDGWTRTTIASIARDASVSPETVYAVFGNKRALIK
ncbi:MAG: TetR family transcriptional regulator, partial [Mesorhizobium sp.]|nr:TetR family transcriptional regulator [Mesorhizobium sp.]